MGQRTLELEALGAGAVGIAVTATFPQQAFARSLGLRFPLVSDWSREVATAYGVRYDVWKGHDGVAKRALFVIDQGGIVRYRWVTENAEILPDFDEAFAALRAVLS